MAYAPGNEGIDVLPFVDVIYETCYNVEVNLLCIYFMERQKRKGTWCFVFESII